MTIETVKATYDPTAKAIYVWLGNQRIDSKQEIDKTTVLEQVLVYADLDKENKIVGIEVILPNEIR